MIVANGIVSLFKLIWKAVSFDKIKINLEISDMRENIVKMK